MCAMRDQILTDNVIARCIYVIVLTNYVVELTVPCYKDKGKLQ